MTIAYISDADSILPAKPIELPGGFQAIVEIDLTERPSSVLFRLRRTAIRTTVLPAAVLGGSWMKRQSSRCGTVSCRPPLATTYRQYRVCLQREALSLVQRYGALGGGWQ